MVYENVEKVRMAKGITKTHMAKRLGISLQGYRHIASGNTRLDVERLIIIAETLNVAPAVFFDDKLTVSVVNGYSISSTAAIELTGTVS